MVSLYILPSEKWITKHRGLRFPDAVLCVFLGYDRSSAMQFFCLRLTRDRRGRRL